MTCALVIETDFALGELAAMSLARGGYHVEHMNDTVAALCELYCWQPDAIIVEDHMPIMSGGDFCRAVKQQDFLAHIPVVIVSDGDSSHDLRYFSETGADAVIVKPYRPGDLLRLVDTLRADTTMLVS